MDSVEATPTSYRDYATVAASYATLAGAITLANVRRDEDLGPVDLGELVLYGTATSGLARLLSKEKVTSFVREPFVEEPAEGERHPRGSGPRYVVGELLGCTRCLGAWSGLGLVGLRTLSPRAGRVGAVLLSLYAMNTVLQAAMTGAQAHATREEELAAADAPA